MGCKTICAVQQPQYHEAEGWRRSKMPEKNGRGRRVKTKQTWFESELLPTEATVKEDFTNKSLPMSETHKRGYRQWADLDHCAEHQPQYHKAKGWRWMKKSTHTNRQTEWTERRQKLTVWAKEEKVQKMPSPTLEGWSDYSIALSMDEQTNMTEMKYKWYRTGRWKTETINTVQQPHTIDFQ